MTLDKFLDAIRDKPEQFAIMWQQNHSISPEDWPLSMSDEDWFEQFNMWLEASA